MVVPLSLAERTMERAAMAAGKKQAAITGCRKTATDIHDVGAIPD